MLRIAPMISASAIILAGALLYVRLLTPAFGPNTVTQDHPAILLCIVLMIASIMWLALLSLLRPLKTPRYVLFSAIVLLGLGLRLLFFGSDPVYENDYKRYLWDGAVTATGGNPYEYTPTEIFQASEPGTSSSPELARLAVLSNTADKLTGEINSPDLTTIYPPASQALFAAAYVIAPFKIWGLQLVFLLTEIIGFAALLACLRRYQKPMIWSGLYWLNPIIIFTTYNGLHMDVLLVAPMMCALLWVKHKPGLSALMLSLAAAIKLWPLILAPILFRQWRNKPLIYFGVAVSVAILTLLSLLPMILSLNENAGLVAYSANWTNSSFLFRVIEGALGLVIGNSDDISRIIVAVALTSMSLWLGFKKTDAPDLIPSHLLLLSAALVFLSPTGYPWYFIWFLMFIPFAANHWSARGLALMTVGASLYFVRFKIGEAGHYEFYRRVLVPLEFGLPLLVLLWDGLKVRKHA